MFELFCTIVVPLNSFKFSALTAPNYYIDANGYLHFDTPVGGDVIISDQPLTAK